MWQPPWEDRNDLASQTSLNDRAGFAGSTREVEGLVFDLKSPFLDFRPDTTKPSKGRGSSS